MDTAYSYNDTRSQPYGKINRRPIPPQSLSRTSLVASIANLVVEGTSPIGIMAPAGSGKSTTLSLVDAELARRGLECSWYIVDGFDALRDLASHCARLEAHSILMLDNLHRLGDDSARLLYALDGLATDFRLIVTFRHHAGIMADYLHDNGVLLTEDDLFFSPSEVAALAERLGLDENLDLDAAIFDVLQGWPGPTKAVFNAILSATSPPELRGNLGLAIIAIRDFLSGECKEGKPWSSRRIARVHDSVARLTRGESVSLQPALDMDALAKLALTPSTPRKGTRQPDDSMRGERIVLGARELMVLRAAANGMKARQIAQDHDISEQTVRTHLRNAYRKLDAHGKDDAIRKAIATGLL